MIPILDLSALIQEVSDTKGTEDSATLALNKILDAVTAANETSKQAVTDLVAQLKASRDPLATAVANVPA